MHRIPPGVITSAQTASEELKSAEEKLQSATVPTTEEVKSSATEKLKSAEEKLQPASSMLAVNEIKYQANDAGKNHPRV
jgi:hypothetical protein